MSDRKIRHEVVFRNRLDIESVDSGDIYTLDRRPEASC